MGRKIHKGKTIKQYVADRNRNLKPEPIQPIELALKNYMDQIVFGSPDILPDNCRICEKCRCVFKFDSEISHIYLRNSKGKMGNCNRCEECDLNIK